MTNRERFMRIYERFALHVYFNIKRRKGLMGFHSITLDQAKQAYKTAPTLKNQIKSVSEILKKEASKYFGYYGNYLGVSFSVTHSYKGIELQVGDCKPQNEAYSHTYKFNYTWSQFAEMLIRRGVFQ